VKEGKNFDHRTELLTVR